MAKRKADDSDSSGETLLSSMSGPSENPVIPTSNDTISPPNEPTHVPVAEERHIEKNQISSKATNVSAASTDQSPAPGDYSRTEETRGEASSTEGAFDSLIQLASPQTQPFSDHIAADERQEALTGSSIAGVPSIHGDHGQGTSNAVKDLTLANVSESRPDKTKFISKSTRSTARVQKAATKSQTKPKSNISRKAKGRTAATELEDPKPKRINKAVKAKTLQVVEFMRENHPSVLTRSSANNDHVIVSESTLMGALMSMHADYGMSDDPLRASLLDAQGAIEKEFEKPIGTLQIPVKHYVLNFAEQTIFEQGIKLKIRGHLDVENVNLLEVQLEMNTRQMEEAAASNLLTACLAAFDDATDAEEDVLLAAAVENPDVAEVDDANNAEEDVPLATAAENHSVAEVDDEPTSTMAADVEVTVSKSIKTNDIALTGEGTANEEFKNVVGADC